MMHSGLKKWIKPLKRSQKVRLRKEMEKRKKEKLIMERNSMDKILIEKVVEVAWKKAKPEAEWIIENKVYPKGEFLVSKDTYRIKVGDGEHSYNELPFISREESDN